MKDKEEIELEKLSKKAKESNIDIVPFFDSLKDRESLVKGASQLSQASRRRLINHLPSTQSVAHYLNALMETHHSCIHDPGTRASYEHSIFCKLSPEQQTNFREGRWTPEVVGAVYTAQQKEGVLRRSSTKTVYSYAHPQKPVSTPMGGQPKKR
jgi:hypothetical protein